MLWLVCGVLLPLSSWRPEASTASRLVTLFALAGLATLPVRLAWASRGARVVVLATPAVVLVALLLPARAADPEALRVAYLTELRTFAGVEYVWGGETHRGIDCSGLVRVALLHAMASEALRRVDPGLARRALELWWFDASASALGQGYRGWTRELGRSASLASLDARAVRPGDLAVTEDGLHVLAHLGDATWIQADPLPMRVHLDAVTPGAGGWFSRPVVLVRWRWLE